MPVIVVPIFEPKVNGKTRSIVTIPNPTNGVKVEVKTLLDCTIMVRIHPIKIATKGVQYLSGPGRSPLTILKLF